MQQASRNASWGRCWGRAAQLLANVFTRPSPLHAHTMQAKAWFSLAHKHFTAKNVCACSTKNDTWSISGNVIGSEAKMPVEMKKIMAVFLTVIALWFSCHSKRSKNILVKVLSGMFSLENVAPWKRRKNPVVVICRRYWLYNRRHGCERHAKKVGNFWLSMLTASFVHIGTVCCPVSGHFSLKLQ